MQSSSLPVVKDLILVGGGHSHVTVLKRFGMKPLEGVRLTLVARDVHTPYSGMLPGLIAGHYTFDQTHIDLEPLSRFAGARLIRDEVTGIEPDSRRLLFEARPPLDYDVVSINIGSTPSLGRVTGAAEHAVAVKPIHTFLERWEELRQRVVRPDGSRRIAVVGAGAGGVELLLAVRHRLQGEFETAGLDFARLEFLLFASSYHVLPHHNASTQRRFDRVLREREVHVHLGARVSEVTAHGVRVEGGAFHEVDETLWVTQAEAARWPGEGGLDVDEGGFIKVDASLRSVSHEAVFAAGDVAAVVPHPREKAGVFAVRQGPPLERNLRRALTGRSLEPFRPQKEFLTIISTGDRYAVASRGPFSVEGAWVWRWKDWIDRRFMDRYNVLPEMPEPDAPAVPEGLADTEALEVIARSAMRCSGCGAKVGASVLERVLRRVDLPRGGDGVIIGIDAPDDAAVFSVREGHVVVQTVDFFRSLIDDPWIFGRVAANHCLGDLFAMGAEPTGAVAIATVPHGLERKTEETLVHVLQGASEVLRDAGAALLGGHTAEASELAFGLTVNGEIRPADILRKGGLRPGDRLILTKPLGTGTLFAAAMRSQAKGRWIAAALDSMQHTNRHAVPVLRAHGATACTDITGFGLIGHLFEMAQASGVGVELELGKMPLLDGALDTVRAGIFSSLQPQNLRLRRAVSGVEELGSSPRYALAFDPQTAGGLLAGVPAAGADGCLQKLRDAGYEHAVEIGTVIETATGDLPVRLCR